MTYLQLLELIKNAHNRQCSYCKHWFVAYSASEEICSDEECMNRLDDYYLNLVYG